MDGFIDWFLTKSFVAILVHWELETLSCILEYYILAIYFGKRTGFVRFLTRICIHLQSHDVLVVFDG